MSKNFLNYVPAQLHENKEIYISYYVQNPKSEKLIRRKIRLNKYKSRGKTQMRIIARQIIKNLNEKLAQGWNPFIEQESAKSFHLLFDAFDIFLKVKSKELRPDSMRDYTSRIKKLKEYCTNNLKSKNMYAISFTRSNAVDYLNYLYTETDISAIVYNNYKSFGVTLWNWLIENQYCKTNVFKQIKKKVTTQKKRIVIDAETRKMVQKHLIETNQIEFLALLQLTYFAFLRPKESTFLKAKNIDLKNRIIIVDSAFAKNRKMRKVTIPDTLYNTLKKLNIENIPEDYYIFSENYKPGKKRIISRKISRTWSYLRRDLGLPMEMQFYSFKDTGIVELIRSGVTPEAVRDQAGHSSLEMTNKYIMTATNMANKQILDKSKDF